jgi:hypothetical protein
MGSIQTISNGRKSESSYVLSSRNFHHHVGTTHSVAHIATSYTCQRNFRGPYYDTPIQMFRWLSQTRINCLETRRLHLISRVGSSRFRFVSSWERLRMRPWHYGRSQRLIRAHMSKLG